MFDRYDDDIQYLQVSSSKDMFGYGSKQPVDKKVRFVGLETHTSSSNNTIKTEDRYIFHCPFEVQIGDSFIYKNNKLLVKSVEECRDIFGTRIFWRVGVI